VSRFSKHLQIVPGARIKVLIVDDSAVVRGFLRHWLSESEHVEIIGTASNGSAALDIIKRTPPDVIVLDIEMPHMDGLEALPHIKRMVPEARIIVSSHLTQKAAALALRCLELGATDVMSKPSFVEDPTSLAQFKHDLCTKVCGVVGLTSTPKPAEPVAETAPGKPKPPAAILDFPRSVGKAPAKARETVRAIIIGASTGGPIALMNLLTQLVPVIERVPVIIAQHMPPVFTSVLADHLAVAVAMPVAEAIDGEPVLPGRIYLAPGGKHLVIEHAAGTPRLRIDDGPAVRFARPSIDMLFSSAAKVYGAGSLGIVLTGMGSDGVYGARDIADVGGSIMVQDEASSIVWGMPSAVIKAGIVPEGLSIPRIAEATHQAVLGRRA
jgi:two-component system, chemotaxis family, protein-glutamate methylesterase/glutaminase